MEIDTEVFESLGRCVHALKLGSPEGPSQDSPLPPPTIRKFNIKIKAKPSPSPTSPPPISLPQSEDVSFEASLPILPNIAGHEEPTTTDISSPDKPKRIIRMKKESKAQSATVEVPPEPAEPTEEESIIGTIISSLFQDDETSELPPQNQWVRPIKFEGQIKWKNYGKKSEFKRVAWIVPDLAVVEEAPKKGKGNPSKQPGDKKRQTFIQFVNTISVNLWKEPVEWIYILVIDGYIVKIGGTRVGLDERCRSYLSGHCVPEKGGKSVSTNAFIYHTFHWYLEQGMSIEMYGYRIEPKQDTDTMLGFTETYSISRYHVWEAKLLGEFERLYGKKPPLSSNSDPKYRKGEIEKKEKGKGKGKAVAKK